MKVVKSDLVDFLKKVILGGLTETFTIEEDGSVNVLIEKSNLVFFGKSPNFKGFGKKVGVGTPDLLLKIINALESADNTINAEVKGNDILFATRSGKYNFRTADADTITSMKNEAESFLANKTEIKNQIALSVETISAIRKSISILAGKDTDTVSFFGNEGSLQIVATDDASKCSSTTNVGNIEGEFKIDFKASDVAKILDQTGSGGAIAYVMEGKPLIIELTDKSFTYMLSHIIKAA